VYDATVWVLLKCFAPTSVIMCKHLFCNLFWLFIFCAPTLFDYTYDMDHVSEIKCYYYYYYSLRISLESSTFNKDKCNRL